MENRSKKFTAAKFILMGCAVLLALVVGTYAWQVSKPTGFERLPKVATLKAKSALRKQKPVIVNTPQQPAKAPVIPPPPLEKKSPLPLSANSFYTKFGVGLYGLTQYVMPTRPWWLTVVRDSDKGTGRVPDDQLLWIQEHVPFYLRAPETPKELRDNFAESVTKLETAFAESDGWEEPTVETAYANGKDFGTTTIFAAVTATVSAARGDRVAANDRMQDVLKVSAKLYPVSLGGSSLLTGYLVGLDANDMLTSETLELAADIADDNVYSQVEYEDLRKANIRAVAEHISATADSWPLDDSIGTYFLNGVPSRMVRMALIPAAQKSLEAYAVAVANRNPQDILTARRDFFQKTFLMNVKMQVDFENLQNEYGAGFQVGAHDSDSPRADMDFARAGLLQMNRPAYQSRMVVACLQYRQQRGDWPANYADVEPFLPTNFREQTGSDWVLMKSRELSYYASNWMKPPPLIDQYKTKMNAFPTTAKQLANFAGMPDEAPLEELFGSRIFDLIIVEVRRHPVYEWNGENIYDLVGADGEAISSKYTGARRLEKQMIQTSFFYIPTREETRSKMALLIEGAAKKP